ncbi:hypothetical protein B0H13DRAFT_2315260 [Mycena leptocephala]|nr:hypothetical protein B0H13DRAFT_2315260 [Mycena leptocephala]
MVNTCEPFFLPSPGNEDRQKHKNTAGKWFYVVGHGYQLGIYTDEWIARKQVEGFSNGQWKKEKKWDDAMEVWKTMCSRFHRHKSSPATSSRIAAGPLIGLSHSPASSLFRLVALTLASSRLLSCLYKLARFVEHCCIHTANQPFCHHSYFTHARVSCQSTGVSAHQVSSTRIVWADGDVLAGIRGVALFFENRYDMVDYIFENCIGTADVMETRNRRKLEAFVMNRRYVREVGDPDSD